MNNIHKHQVFLTGFCSKQYTQQELSQALSECLPGFKSIIVPKKVYNGFAFLELIDEATKHNILANKEIQVEGHSFIVKEVKQGQDLYRDRKNTLNRKVFVSNIPQNWSNSVVEKCFSRFGIIEEAYACKEKGETILKSAELGLRFSAIQR